MAPPLLSVDVFSRDHHALHELQGRDLANPTRTQQVTLGFIGAYVVAIAILWNVPYLKMLLWPFKVSARTRTR